MSLDAAVRLVALVHVCVVLVDGLEAINLVYACELELHVSCS